ncbi:MAG: hypothetical protein Q3998_05085 [Porphyromonas sp.]|nr:hypothetical protein [Porphyromonas sp.]
MTAIKRIKVYIASDNLTCHVTKLAKRGLSKRRSRKAMGAVPEYSA